MLLDTFDLEPCRLFFGVVTNVIGHGLTDVARVVRCLGSLRLHNFLQIVTQLVRLHIVNSLVGHGSLDRVTEQGLRCIV